MTEHLITPPLELVEQWSAEIYEQTACEEITCSQHIATQAARWGADQELEACCKLLELSDSNAREFLCSARRPKPKPSSLKEQALRAIQDIDDACESEGFSRSDDVDIIRRAIESLPEYSTVKRYFRSLAHHPGLFYASFLTALGAAVGAQSGSLRAAVAGIAVMSIFWIPVLVTAAQYDYRQDS